MSTFLVVRASACRRFRRNNRCSSRSLRWRSAGHSDFPRSEERVIKLASSTSKWESGRPQHSPERTAGRSLRSLIEDPTSKSGQERRGARGRANSLDETDAGVFLTIETAPSGADFGSGRDALADPQGAWRRGWDSNPRWHRCHAGFQDRCLKPLGHLSGSQFSSCAPRRASYRGAQPA